MPSKALSKSVSEQSLANQSVTTVTNIKAKVNYAEELFMKAAEVDVRERSASKSRVQPKN